MTIKMTSAAGEFFFPPTYLEYAKDGRTRVVPTVLAKAKLIRDTVTAQVMMPDNDLPRVTNNASAQRFMSSFGDRLASVPFFFERTA